MRYLEEAARIVQESTRTEHGIDPFSSAVRATRMPMPMTDRRRPDNPPGNPIAFASGALAKLTGFERDDGWRPRRLPFALRETGGPPVTPSTRTGSAPRLIERVVAREIGGKAEIDYRPDGVGFLAIAPLLRAAEEPSDQQ